MPRYKLLQGGHVIPDKSQPKDERTGRYPAKMLKIGDVFDSDEDLVTKHGPGHFELVSGERVSSDLSRQLATLQRENHLLRGELSWYQAESGRLRALLEQHVGSNKAVKEALAETGKPPAHTPEAGLKTPAPAATEPPAAEAVPEGEPPQGMPPSSEESEPQPSEREIRSMSAKQLRDLAGKHGIDLAHATTARQMADRVIENLHSSD